MVIFFFGRRNYKILHKTKSQITLLSCVKDYSSCSEEVFHSLLGGNLSIFLYTYMYKSVSFSIFSIVSYCKILNIFPCAVYIIHGSLHLLILCSQFIPPPFGKHKFSQCSQYNSLFHFNSCCEHWDA